MDKLTTQQGLTLIELMIAMTLGLLVIAAAISIFLAGQRSLATQTGLSELQQTAIFGLSRLTYDIRHANLNTGSATINTTTPASGIVFATNATENIDNNIITKNAGNNALYNNLTNDQLTIRFQPHADNLLTLTDCEGNAIPAGTTVVQRYYIDVTNSVNGVQRYGLYCDAAHVGNKNIAFNRNPTIVIPDAEAFKVRFGVRNNGNVTTLRYKTMGQVANTDQIMSVELNLILRSTSTVGSNSMIDDSRTFTIAGQNDVTLRDQSQNPQYLREVFTQVVALRNDQGS